jgi:hypothetical protein
MKGEVTYSKDSVTKVATNITKVLIRSWNQVHGNFLFLVHGFNEGKRVSIGFYKREKIINKI